MLIERHQWIAAATAFANPVLALGPLAVGAVQLRMLSEIAALHEVPLSTESLEMVGRQMVQTLFKLGIAEAAGSVLAGIFKFNPLGFAAGGIVQATTMAYLTPRHRRFLSRVPRARASLGRRRNARHLVAALRRLECSGLVGAIRQSGDRPSLQTLTPSSRVTVRLRHWQTGLLNLAHDAGVVAGRASNCR